MQGDGAADLGGLFFCAFQENYILFPTDLFDEIVGNGIILSVSDWMTLKICRKPGRFWLGDG